MKGINRMTMLFMMLLLVSPLLAVTSHEGKDPSGFPTPSVDFDVSLSAMNISSVGFSSAPVVDISTAVTPISFLPIDRERADAGTFESAEFYIYWKLLGARGSFPDLYLKQQGLLSNANYETAKMDWAVDIKYNEAEAIYEEVLNTTNLLVDGVKIYPRIAPVQEAGDDVLAKDVSSISLRLRTVDPYWNHPNVVYASELWLTVRPR